MVKIPFKNLRLFWWPFIIFTTFITTFAVADNLVLVDALYLSLSLCLTASFACLHNDLIDKECDSINQNNGNGHFITDITDKVISINLSILLLLGLTLSLLVSLKLFFLILTINILLVIYNKIQYISPVATIFSSLTAVTPMLLPVLLWSDSDVKYVVIVTSIFLLVIAREITADISDYKGDIIAGKKSLPVTIGKGRARIVVITISILPLVILISNTVLVAEDKLSIFILLVFILFNLYILNRTIFSNDWGDKEILYRYINLTRYISLFAPFLFFV